MSAKIEKTIQRQKERYLTPPPQFPRLDDPSTDPTTASQKASTTKRTNSSA
jgi:hypothetical protein